MLLLVLNTSLQILQNIAITLQNNVWNHTVHKGKNCLATILNEVKKCNYVFVSVCKCIICKCITFVRITVSAYCFLINTTKTSNLGGMINSHSLNFKNSLLYDNMTIKLFTKYKCWTDLSGILDKNNSCHTYWFKNI